MNNNNWLNNLIIAATFGIGIFFPIVLVFDTLPIAIGGGVIAAILFFLMLTFRAKNEDNKDSASVKTNASLYMRRFAISMWGYIVFLLASVYILNRIEAQNIQVLLALLPVIPVSYGLWAYMQWVRNLDEFQQRIQLEAVAFSLGMTGIVTFTIGFLENAGIPQPGLIWVFPMIIAFWGIGQLIAVRHYE